METLEKIKELTELLSVDATKFYKGNKSAGTRARKTAQELNIGYWITSALESNIGLNAIAQYTANLNIGGYPIY